MKKNRQRTPLLFISISIIIPLLFYCSVYVYAQKPTILLVEIKDTIDHATVETLIEGIREADKRGSEAVILLIDTPGGGLKETFEIADLIKDSKTPIIGYVYPTGAKAWSAGTFILLSTHIAAMAEHTIIGSTQPVEITFEGTKLITSNKTINALVEWIQERASMYGRNQSVAKDFIIKNLNLNATQAKKYGVIEFVSNSIDQLLEQINGIKINTSAGETILHTKNTEKILYSPSIKIQILKIISNPLLCSLLLMLGIFGVIFGISSPGYGAEVFGIIAILLSLVGSGFSISTISIIFIIIGALLLLIEIFATPGFGVIGIGGIICLIIGSIFLIPAYSNESRSWLISMEYIQSMITILIVITALIAIFFVFLLYKILRIRKKKPSVGKFVG
ncbi:MAG: nodulation protein NfeD, partial [Thermoplasmata archaeon]